MTWRERCVAARERGRFTKLDKHLAGSFGTCAVAEQHLLGMPVFGVNPAFTVPHDLEMWGLGYKFSRSAVDGDDVEEAESLLGAIEDRALALKRELHAGDA